ncbi:MAG: ABC transporter ATP-binding protein, partial [Alphaproteobacteria bacterium]
REAPHIILMDEPTNHLDVDSRQALVQAINGYDGAVIIVTHDPHLVELTADRLWIVRHGKVERFEGDMADYRRELLSERRNTQRENRGTGKAATATSTSTDDGQSAEDRKKARQASAAARAALKPLKNKVSAAEKRVEKIQTEINKGHALLADPTVYSDPAKSAKVPGWQKKLGELEKMLEEAEEEWLTLEAELEEAESSAA